jgi:hypothetical protein
VQVGPSTMANSFPESLPPGAEKKGAEKKAATQTQATNSTGRHRHLTAICKQMEKLSGLPMICLQSSLQSSLQSALYSERSNPDLIGGFARLLTLCA